MHKAEAEVECHVIGIVESRKNAEVSDVSDVRDEAGNGQWFEGGRGGRLGRRRRRGRSGVGACVEVEGTDDNCIQCVHYRRCSGEVVKFLSP